MTEPVHVSDDQEGRPSLNGDAMGRLVLLEGRVDALEADRDRHAALADGRLANPTELTRRERETLYLTIAEGCSIKQIAYRLGISHKTAEHHMASLRKRVGVQSRAQLFAWAQEHRYIWAGLPAPTSL